MTDTITLVDAIAFAYEEAEAWIDAHGTDLPFLLDAAQHDLESNDPRLDVWPARLREAAQEAFAKQVKAHALDVLPAMQQEATQLWATLCALKDFKTRHRPRLWVTHNAHQLGQLERLLGRRLSDKDCAIFKARYTETWMQVDTRIWGDQQRLQDRIDTALADLAYFEAQTA